MGRSLLNWAGRRVPYGRRYGSRPFVEGVAPGTPYWWAYPAYYVSHREDARVRAVPMPHGGYRLLYRCPLCSEWRVYLFNVAPFTFCCRVCCGLRYKSQYVGRRLAASAARIEEARAELARSTLADALRRHHESARRAKRAASQRVRRQQATWRARHKRLDAAECEYHHRQYEAEMRELAHLDAYLARARRAA